MIRAEGDEFEGLRAKGRKTLLIKRGWSETVFSS